MHYRSWLTEVSSLAFCHWARCLALVTKKRGARTNYWQNTRVASLPDELFYPAAQKQVLAIIVKKGIPHPKDQPVFWARIAHDGHLKVKSRRLPASELKPPRAEQNDIEAALPQLANFISHPPSVSVNVPMLCKTSPIDFTDPLLELARFIREGAESGVWGDEIAPKMIVAA